MAHSRLKTASHHICHTAAKPKMKANPAMMIPAPVFFGRVIFSYLGSSLSSLACFCAQKASRPVTSGKTAKLYSGGGEVVDHSSVRAFHGSPLRSRFSLRVKMLQASCNIWNTDAQEDYRRANPGHYEQRLPAQRRIIMVQPTSGTHQTQRI